MDLRSGCPFWPIRDGLPEPLPCQPRFASPGARARAANPARRVRLVTDGGWRVWARAVVFANYGGNGVSFGVPAAEIIGMRRWAG